MPRLKRHRQELFAQAIVKGAKDGVTQRAAYVAAGYKSQGDAIDINASRLIRSDKVQQRMDELTRPAIRKARVSVESLLNELDTTVRDARAAKQHSVVVTALGMMARLVGLLRTELVVGSPSEFRDCETPQHVYDQVCADLGENAAKAMKLLALADDGDPGEALALLDELRARLEDRAAAEALPIA